MLYDAYEVQRSFLAGASKLAGLGAGWLNNPTNPWGYSSMGPMVAASLEVFAHASAPRGKPEFGIIETKVGRKIVAVDEDIVLRKPFGQLKYFRKVDAESGRPLLLCPEQHVDELRPEFENVMIAWDHSARAARAVGANPSGQEFTAA